MTRINVKRAAFMALLILLESTALNSSSAASLKLADIHKVCDRLVADPEASSGASFLNCCPVASTIAMSGKEDALEAACGELMKQHP
ncbi:MAG: hypothetical protein P4M05_33590 [Bradyrhizobium sp.]|nr:hypothetical protein [Bradyrhizobium sp.]